MLLKKQIAIRPMSEIVIGGFETFSISAGIIVYIDTEESSAGKAYGIAAGWALPNSSDHGGGLWHRYLFDWENDGDRWALTLLGFRVELFWGW